MTIGQVLTKEKITIAHLRSLQGEHGYWDASVNFLLTCWATEIKDLSPKQQKWFRRIMLNLEQRKTEGRL